MRTPQEIAIEYYKNKEWERRDELAMEFIAVMCYLTGRDASNNTSFFVNFLWENLEELMADFVTEQ
jgi:hypothetical protein